MSNRLSTSVYVFLFVFCIMYHALVIKKITEMSVRNCGVADVVDIFCGHLKSVYCCFFCHGVGLLQMFVM